MKRTTVLLLTAAAFGLRLAYLLHSHPFIDEFTTVLAARAILQRGLPVLPSGLFYEHGLLFSYLDAPFVALAGEGGLFAAARLPSLLIGTATVPFLYWIGRRWLSVRTGLLAAALLAFSPEGMVWGGRARMYALAQFLVLLLAFLVYEGCRGEVSSHVRSASRRGRWLALLVLFATLLTQFGALILVPPLLIGGLAIGWLTRPDGTRPWFLRPTALLESVGLLGVVGIGVWIKRLGRPLGASPLGSSIGGLAEELIGTVTYQAGLVLDGESAIKFLSRQFGVPHHLWLTLVAVVGGLFSLLVWLRVRDWAGHQGDDSHRPGDHVATGGQGVRTAGGWRYALLYLWLVFGLTVVEMVILLEPWRRNPRYLVMTLPLFYLIVVASVEQISRLISAKVDIIGVRKRQQVDGSLISKLKPEIPLVFFAVVQVALLLPDLRIAYRTPEPAYEEAFQYVAEQWQPGDVVLTMNTSAASLILGETDYSSEGVYRFAIQEDAEQFLLEPDARPVDRWLGTPWVGTAADFNQVLNEHRRTWFVVDTIRLPVYYRGDWLALLKTQMDLVWSGDEALVFRSRPDRLLMPASPQETLNASFGDLVRLAGYARNQVAEQSVLQLTLFWTALAPMDTDYTIFIHVRDADNRTVAQWDGPPLDGAYPTSQWRVGETVMTPLQITLPDSLPAGEYWLYVGLYQLETLARLPLSNDVSGENAVIIPLSG